MPDLLAIVSKAVFEKAAASLGVGDLWPIDAYMSASKALAPLAGGGALFLVTVRPDSVLWLVAILESPATSGGAWRAAANSAPITDVTGLIPSIAFASGKGVVRDAKLGMSLQTPRELSAATAGALRAAAQGTSAPVAQGPSAPGASAAANGKRGTRSSAKAGPAAGPKSSPRAVVVKSAVTPVEHRAPPRPDSVPEGSEWDPVERAWERGEADAAGSRQGEWRSWRADGRLLGTCQYVDHEPHGMNRRFHPDGSVASEGTWKAGQLHDCVHHRAAGETDQPWTPDGGDRVVRVLFVSTDGRSNATIRFFDAAGAERDRAGALVPPRPAGVPETARYFSDEDFEPPDGSPGGWVDGRIERGTEEKLGAWRWWSTTGALLRTERFTERGEHVATVVAGESDPAEDVVARFYAEEEDIRHELRDVWTPELDERIRADLPSQPHAVTREYIEFLRSDIEEPGRDLRFRRPRPRLILAVVGAWEARADADAAGVEAWYITGAGARAAYEVRDRERLARWWRRFESIAVPAAFPEDAGAFRILARELTGKGGLRAAIGAALDGSEAAAIAAIAASLASPATAAQVTDEDLARFAQVTVGCARCQVMIRDGETGEAWFLDAENRSHYFDGKAFAPSSVQFDDRSVHDVGYVAPHSRCDERLVLWPGKYGWFVLQRYGRAVLWHSARFSADRGQPEVERHCWFKVGSPAEARRMMALIRAGQPKGTRQIDPWFDKKVGVIVRSYSGPGLNLVGVDGDKLTNGERLIERLGSHAEAVAAFEQLEIDRLRNGGFISRFVASRKDGAD